MTFFIVIENPKLIIKCKVFDSFIIRLSNAAFQKLLNEADEMT